MRQNKTHQILVLLIICVAILSFFHVLRLTKNTALPTYDVYYHLNKIKSGTGFNLLKENSYLLDVIISKSNNQVFFMRLLPFIAGLLNICLIYLILGKIVKNEKQRFITSLIVILSPSFIYVHSVYNNLFLPLSFILLGTLFMLKDKYFYSMLSLFVVLVFNLSLFIIILLLLFVFYEKLKSKNLFLPVLGIVLVSYVFTTINPGFTQPLSIYFLLTKYVSDFGALIGFGFFNLALAVLGIFLSWNEKVKNAIIYYTLIALFICSLYEHSFVVFLDLILAYYSGYAFIKIWKSKWQSKTLKNYVMLLILCGLIFSSGSYLNEMSKVGPKQSEILSLVWLKDKIKPDTKILSHYEYGYLIKTFSGATPYTDKTYFLRSKDKLKIKLSNDVFASRNLKKILDFFNKEKIEYVWINQAMKNGQVWNREEEGILLILENSPNFERQYDYFGIEIWKYKDLRI